MRVRTAGRLKYPRRVAFCPHQPARTFDFPWLNRAYARLISPNRGYARPKTSSSPPAYPARLLVQTLGAVTPSS
jgi:hypothetical protein